MLGAEEPATARISSMEAVPTRKRNLMICSQRPFRVSGMTRTILHALGLLNHQLSNFCDNFDSKPAILAMFLSESIYCDQRCSATESTKRAVSQCVGDRSEISRKPVCTENSAHTAISEFRGACENCSFFRSTRLHGPIMSVRRENAHSDDLDKSIHCALMFPCVSSRSDP